MSGRGHVSPEVIRFALADSIAFLKADDWDRVSARSGLFLSRRFLEQLERNLPDNLATHYALAYSRGRPVAAIVAQSLDIRVADLSSGRTPDEGRGLWHSVEAAAERSITRARKRVLLFDVLLPWARFDEAVPSEKQAELWPEVASSLWRRWHSLLKTAELPVAWIHQRLLVCGNLLSTGPHGAAFADGEDPAQLWPAVEEAVYRIRGSIKLFGDSDLVMIKDLTEEQKEAVAALRRFHFRRFETEPNMILQDGNIRLPILIKLHTLLTVCDVYSHLDGVLLSIINKGNSFIILRNAIHGHSRPAPGGVGLQDSDVIESLPVPVVYLERLPIRG